MASYLIPASGDPAWPVGLQEIFQRNFGIGKPDMDQMFTNLLDRMRTVLSEARDSDRAATDGDIRAQITAALEHLEALEAHAMQGLP